MILKYNNRTFLFIQLIIIILSIKFITKDICYDFELTSGSNLITKYSKSSWRVINSKIYNNEILSEFLKIKYHDIYNYEKDEYPMFKGHIMLFDKNDEIIAVFDKFLLQFNYYEFIYYFNDNVDMNKEIYKLDIKDGFLYLMFLNTCSNNSVIYEKDNYCLIKDKYYNNINTFMQEYFYERLKLPDSCYNNILYITLKFLLVFLILNIFIYIVLFIIRFLNITNHNNDYILLN